jgi:hypothetical protein
MIWLGTKDVVTKRAATPIGCPGWVIDEWGKIFQTALIIFKLMLSTCENRGERKGKDEKRQRTLSKSR